MVGRWNWDEPVLRLAADAFTAEELAQLQRTTRPGPAYLMDAPTTGRIELLAPPPAAIAAFLDVVRSMNNSVTWGTVEPGASVMRWLEGLAHE
jgi:hypothetical protein